MSLNAGNPQTNEIDTLIEDTYTQLMMLRVEFSILKRQGVKGLEIEKMENQIGELNADFEGFIKTKTLYNKYQKSMGITGANASKELLDKIKEIKSGVSSIVSNVPKS